MKFSLLVSLVSPLKISHKKTNYCTAALEAKSKQDGVDVYIHEITLEILNFAADTLSCINIFTPEESSTRLYHVLINLNDFIY